MPDFPSIPFSPPSIPAGLDPMAVGKSFFEEAPEIPDAPAIEGYSEFTFLARGGFGTVWSARSGAHGIPVALKIPHVADGDVAERLELEAETLRSLDHPNIVRLLDLTVTDQGLPVLVMELVEGLTLTQSLPARGFDFDHALQIFLPVLDAVAHAHSRGIVHRDLKPSNILLSSDGTPKVSDFGLAQPLKDQAVAFSLTKSGIIAGTVEYLAPERYEPGHKPDPAADIFALGVILYEMLSGRPPRGSWQPLSQLKRLDVRLDELLAKAIHPDPAKRLPSAEHFAKRLTEIRDSRPRYAGTPLVTRAVRITDALWTAAGLYYLAAGFCSLLSMNSTKVPGVFDLTFDHTKLLGGYWALWVLCIGMGAVWTWQLIRLWRFRHIPLREALPSPFGFKLGHSRGAAVLVALTQLLCAWAPLVYMVWIYSQCWFWAAPDTAPWERVLAITRWSSETPVSQWTWDLSGMFSGDRFWIRDVHPADEPGRWHLNDRQSFFVITQPLLMAMGLAAAAIGIIATAIAACVEWKRRRWKLLAVCVSSLAFLGFSLHATVLIESADRLNDRKDPLKWATDIADRRMWFEVTPHVRQTVRAWISASASFNGKSLSESVRLAFTPEVEYGDGNRISRENLIEVLSNQHQAFVTGNRTFEAGRFLLFDPRPPLNGVCASAYVAESYTSPPGAPATGSFLRVAIKSRLPDSVPAVGAAPEILTGWSLVETPLYVATSRDITTPEAGQWLLSFLACLNSPGCPELESFLLPSILRLEPSDSRNFSPGPRSTIVERFQTTIASRPGLQFQIAATPECRPLSGGRQEITCPLRIFAPTPARSPSETLVWRMELVFAGGRWQVLRIRV